jgi:hypothetical protein
VKSQTAFFDQKAEIIHDETGLKNETCRLPVLK